MPSSGIPAEGKVQEGNYVNDKKEGFWIKYHDDGKTPKMKGEYANNRPVGVYTKIGSSNMIREIGTFEKNKQLDSLKRFYENGQLEYEAWYNEDGKEQGRVNFYFETGQLEYTYIANNVVPTESQSFDKEGNPTPERRISRCDEIKEPIIYAPDSKPFPGCVDPIDPKNSSNTTPIYAPATPETPTTKGVPFKTEGYNKVYNEDNEIWLDGKFVNGQLYDGKNYVYDRDGILLKVRVFKKGVYFADGQL